MLDQYLAKFAPTDVLTHRDLSRRAIELHERVRETLVAAGEWDDETETLYSFGLTRLRTLEATALDEPLSNAARELAQAYLGGPDWDDIDAVRMWLSSWPDLMVQLRQHEAREPSLARTWWRWFADTAMVGSYAYAGPITITVAAPAATINFTTEPFRAHVGRPTIHVSAYISTGGWQWTRTVQHGSPVDEVHARPVPAEGRQSALATAA